MFGITRILLDTYDAERRPVALVRHDQIFARDDYKVHLSPESKWRGLDTAVLDDTAMELGQLYRSEGVIGAEDPALPSAKRPDEWAGQPGTRAPHLWLVRGGDKVSSLDLFGHGWVVVSEDEAWKEAVSRAAAVLDVNGGCEFVHVGTNGDVQPVLGGEGEGAFRQMFGLEQSGAALDRPDGYIAWRAVQMPTTDAAGEFLQALAKVSHATRG